MLRRVLVKLSKNLLKKSFSRNILKTSQAATMSESTGVKRNADSTDGDSDAKKIKTDELESEVTQSGDNVSVNVRLKKKKIALLMIYSGKGYYGMQKNPGFKNIEEDLTTALYKAGVIPIEHAKNMSKMQFQRAARTDKGVSAAGQVVSFKMWVNVDNYLQKINDNLPAQIRVIDIMRVTNSFNSKNSCSGRTYSYLTPTFAFADIDEYVTFDYRLKNPKETIEKVNRILNLYIGTHNFHNFTSGKKPNDASAMRYIIEMKCGQPYVTDGIEFAVITVLGQSFMLHQIRKMIGLVIAIVRGFIGEDAIEKAWSHDKRDVPRAPGLGLMLEKVHYDMYNRRYGDDGIHEPLTFESHQETIEKFKHEFIYKTMIETEKEEGTMMKWLATLPSHHFNIMEEDGKRLLTGHAQAEILVDRLDKQEEAAATCKTETVSETKDNIAKTETSEVEQKEDLVAPSGAEPDWLTKDVSGYKADDVDSDMVPDSSNTETSSQNNETKDSLEQCQEVTQSS